MSKGIDKLRRKLRGYLKVPRERHLRAMSAGLDDRGFRLLEIYRDLSDWDPKHTETYMTFSVADADVAKLLNWDPSKVSRVRKALFSKGLILKKEDGSYEVTDYTLQDTYSDAIKAFVDDAGMQDKDVKMQHYVASAQDKIAPVHEDRGYTVNSSLVSFKGDSVSLMPCDKYLELEKGGRFGTMTADDMEFIEPSSPEWQLRRDLILSS